MDSQELSTFLKEKGFKEEKQDTGFMYSKVSGHVELLCYIEPGIEIEFIAVYKWDNNDVKGTFNLTMDELKVEKDSIDSLFKRTKNNLPLHIGEKINVHTEVDKVIEETFN